MAIYYEKIAEAIETDSRVLDLGCGDGEYSGIKVTGFDGKELVGLDLNAELLAQNEYCDHRVLGDAQVLPFADGVFDLVLTRALFEHLTNPKAAIAEIGRVLKPGGKVILGTYNRLNPLGFFSSSISAKTRAALKKVFAHTELLEGNYEAYYRCNTGGKLKRTFRKHGVEPILISYQDIGLRWLKRPVMKFLIDSFQKVTNITFLRCFKFEVFYMGIKK